MLINSARSDLSWRTSQILRVRASSGREPEKGGSVARSSFSPCHSRSPPALRADRFGGQALARTPRDAAWRRVSAPGARARFHRGLFRAVCAARRRGGWRLSCCAPRGGRAQGREAESCGVWIERVRSNGAQWMATSSRLRSETSILWTTIESCHHPGGLRHALCTRAALSRFSEGRRGCRGVRGRSGRTLRAGLTNQRARFSVAPKKKLELCGVGGRVGDRRSKCGSCADCAVFTR